MKIKILVIQNDRCNRQDVIQFLENEGFEAIPAENGTLGIAFAKQYLPDLIICDILMPELDGYDVLTHLQKHSSTANIPFIFLTIADEKEKSQEDLNLWSDGYLSKPIVGSELKRAINNQLNKKNTLVSEAIDKQVPTDSFQEKLGKLQNSLHKQKNILDNLYQDLEKPLSQMSDALEMLQEKNIEEKRILQIKKLQEEFVSMLSIFDRVTELKYVLQPKDLNNTEKIRVLDKKQRKEIRKEENL
jgi:CheY-like chemotaxis protein